VLGPGQAAPGELLDLPDAVAERLLVDVQFRGGQLPGPVVPQYDPERIDVGGAVLGVVGERS
jgi:hypothetical protein